MTTDELNAIVQAVMLEMEKAGVDFDFKAETPQADDLVYVMRGTADKYQGITVKWQNLLDIIVQKATEAKNEAVSAKDIALQTLATIQSIESNVSSMKSSVDASEANVASMKASVETSEANVTQMKSDVSTMKASVEGTKTEVEGLKVQTQTIVDNAEEQVTGLLNTKADVTYVDGELAKKVNYTDALTYEEIMATNPVPDLTNKVARASALQEIGGRILTGLGSFQTSETGLVSTTVSFGVTLPNKPTAILLTWVDVITVLNNFNGLNAREYSQTGFVATTKKLTTDEQAWFFRWLAIY